MDRMPLPLIRLLLLLTILGLTPSDADGLPINFQHNQAALNYDEITSPHFYIYHDRRAATEAKMTLNSMEAVRPTLQRWLGVNRTSPLPVILTPIGTNASFANFITDAIELQTQGLGERDLFWHEYVHATMYLHYYNWLGPPGAILHLAWMPAWWIEGLAEALSVSVGSDVQAGIERYHALSGEWPTYDSLHNLYGVGNFSLRGYSTSGALVAYLLRRHNADKLADLHREFFRYTMPWWWVWGSVPFNDFMPMDRTLENETSLNGEELYASYQVSARKHWRSNKIGPFLSGEGQSRATFSGLAGVASRGNELFHVISDIDRSVALYQLSIDRSGWVTGSRRHKELPEEVLSSTVVMGAKHTHYATFQRNERGYLRYRISGSSGRHIPRKARPTKIIDFGDHLAWFEHNLERTRLCFVKQSPKRKKVKCPVSHRLPQELRYLGAEYAADGSAKQVWFTVRRQKMDGDTFEVFTWSPQRGPQKLSWPHPHSSPIAFARAKNDRWILVAQQDRRTLLKVDADGRCTQSLTFADHIMDFHGLADGRLALGLFAGNDRTIRVIDPKAYPAKACKRLTAHHSPLLAAMREGQPVSLSLAVKKSNFWQPQPTAPQTSQPTAKQTIAGDGPDQKSASPAKWRPRPVLGVPWIGADDPLGNHYGLLSIPLMDHMQNDTLRLTLLYGLESRFPHQELSWVNTRFWPTLSFDAFRYQTFNGLMRVSQNKTELSYLDERGARVSATLPLHRTGMTVKAGMKSSYLKPFLGPYRVRRGRLNEPFAMLNFVATPGAYTWSTYLSGRGAPSSFNESFDYNVLGIGTTLARPLRFLDSSVSVGADGSRTRGMKRRELQELYRPLKTFVPGSGGGYNQNSFPFIGSGSLFTARYGDTQARTRLNWVVPLIPEFDKQIWILYIDRLDLTAFVNYGGAWRDSLPVAEDLVAAHGYNVDMQFENKGVRFNLGMGTGQVVGESFQAYITTGFDAIF